MIAISTHKGLKFVWKFAWKMWVVPYYPLSKKSGQLYISLTQDKLRIQAVKLSTILMSFYVAYVLLKFYDGLVSGKIPTQLRTKFIVKMMYLSLAYGYSGIAQVNAWKKWQEIPVILQNFLNFFKMGNKEKP